MKKILLIIGSTFVLTAILLLNVNLDVVNNKMFLTSNDVKAEYNWEMKTVQCKTKPGTYKRCEQVPYSSNCDVSEQTFCGEQE